MPRALAPDLARGGMLLFIAFAHAPLFVTDINRGPAVANEVLSVFHLLFVHNHARPMFAFLFGYAMVQMLDRRLARGDDWIPTRKMLRRRNWWLIAIGFAHMLILVPIDILAVYGLAGVLLVGLLRARNKTLLWAAALTAVPGTAAAALGVWIPLANGVSSYTVGSVSSRGRDILEMVTDRLSAWPFGLIIGTLMVIPGVILGMWAARRRVLDEPSRHRKFLVRASIITTAVSVLGAVPAILMETGAWTQPSTAAIGVASILQPAAGYAGGIGMAFIIALIAIAASRRRNAITTAIQALGQRSMSFYLFQSVVFVAVFAPFAFGLEDALGLTGATAVAAATWLVSLVIADVMRRGGYRGPAENLLRRLTYRRPRR